MVTVKLCKILFVTTLLAMVVVVSTCHSANNLAFKKPYTVSPLPNYTLTASATDKTSLTDGKYTFGFFWKQKTTLGWSNWQRTVEIMIDLGQNANIAGITFNTARRSGANVNYPSHITAFVGSTKNQFQYVGNIANDPDNVIGPYQIKKFALDGISARGRYILLLVQPKGPYLFCDEIEVLEGSAVTAKPEEITLEAARSFSLELLRLDVGKKLLGELINEIKTNFNPGSDSAQLLEGMQQRLDTLSALKDVESTQADLLKLRASLLSAKFPGKLFAVEIVNPWAPLSPAALSQAVPEKSISIELPQGGYDHAAFVVTNLSKDSQEIFIQPDESPSYAPDLAFFQVPFVKSATVEYIADPLVPIKDKLTLRSGESKMVFLTAHGLHPGSWENTLKVGTSAYSNTLPLSLQVSKVALPQQLSLNTVNWGYLDLKPIRDRKTEAANDLLRHHINVIVIPPQYIPTADQPSLEKLMRLDEYLKLHIGATKVLFFLNFNDERLLTANGKYPFMSDKWKQWFKKLHTRAVTSAVQAGFQKNNIYMYPYDEINEKDLPRFIELATWAHKEIVGIKLYATLNRKESLSALPYLDVAQINREDLYAGAISSKKEIWLYGTSENTKSLSPYTYYRLMSWRAFAIGFTGAGFWNYADTGSGEYASSAWDDFDGKRPDFSVIYEGDVNTIVSSRRWEAWRMGVEDYELLSMYAKVKGNKVAKKLAELVVNKPEKVGMADEVRHKIMRELSPLMGD